MRESWAKESEVEMLLESAMSNDDLRLDRTWRMANQCDAELYESLFLRSMFGNLFFGKPPSVIFANV